jgi:NAD(P)-dependent dehydrogenase (short-subunit alcohol dehydrogenase family)
MSGKLRCRFAQVPLYKCYNNEKMFAFLVGFETCKALAFHGATVIMACRNLEKGNKCKATILLDRPSAMIEVLHLDLASLRSVKQFTDEYKRRGWY